MAKKNNTFDGSSLLHYMFPKDMLKYFEITAQLQESVDAPAADHPNNTTK